MNPNLQEFTSQRSSIIEYSKLAMKEQDSVIDLPKSKGDLRTQLQQLKPSNLANNIDHQNWLLAIFPLSSFSLIVQIH